MKKIIFSLVICSALFICGCKKSSSNPSFTPDCTGAAKSFSKDVNPIFATICAGCHANFGSYSQIAADKSAIRSRIIDGTMPQNGSLSDAQKNNIVCWIDSGAPNN
ncbi:MAG: cytochrome c [Bacteroidetes bacterium]|nr:cytochrome c [Bacteroidota bacterium]